MRTFIRLWVAICLSLYSLSGQVQYEQPYKGDISYFHFANPTHLKVLVAINKSLSYRGMLSNMILQAPNEYSKAEVDALKLTEIEKIIQKKEGSLASIHTEISYNEDDFLVIDQAISGEGYHKVSNSLHTEYPYFYPQVYDLRNDKKIRYIDELITKAGLRYIQKLAQRAWRIRALAFCKQPRQDCRIGHTGICALLDSNFHMLTSTQRKEIPDEIYFDFSMDGQYLKLFSNDLVHAEVICVDPYSQLDIPWFEIQDFIQPNYKARIQDIIKPHKPLVDTVHKVHQPCINLLPLPYEESSDTEPQKIQPYVIEGDMLTIQYQLNGWCRVAYQNTAGKFVYGWVKAEKLK